MDVFPYIPALLIMESNEIEQCNIFNYSAVKMDSIPIDAFRPIYPFTKR